MLFRLKLFEVLPANAMMVVSQVNRQLSYLQYAVRIIIFELIESHSYSLTQFLCLVFLCLPCLTNLISYHYKSKKTYIN